MKAVRSWRIAKLAVLIIFASQLSSCKNAEVITSGLASLFSSVYGVPNNPSTDSFLNIYISGYGFQSYSYKVGIGVDCSTAAGYSSEVDIQVPITDSLGTDGFYNLCIITKDHSGNWSSYSDAMIFSWTKDSTAPTLNMTTPAGGELMMGGNMAGITWTAADVHFGSLPILIEYSSDGGANWSPVANVSDSPSSYNWNVPNEDTASAAIRLKATDILGQFVYSSSSYFTIDSTAPSVLSVSTPNVNGTYTVGQTIDIDVQFSEAVYVIGTPQLTLNGDVQNPVINYASGSGTNSLRFQFVVTANNSSADLDYLSTSALALNGGTIKDLVGHAADLTLPTPGSAGSLSGSADLVVVGLAILSITDGPLYNFGSVAVGATATKVFTVTNIGGAGASSMSEAGLASPFTFTGGTFPGTAGDCGSFLALGSSCTIEIEFSPLSTAVSTDTISLIYYDGASAQSADRNLSGTGVNPANLTITDTNPFDFGSIMVGSTVEHSFTLSNSGDAPATSISGILSGFPFNFKGGIFPGDGSTCGTSLAGGATCMIVVEYNPLSQTFESDILMISYNNGVSNIGYNHNIQGTGTSGSANFYSLALGNEQSCAIDNLGNAKCWGRGLEGQLGNGDFSTSPSAVPVSGSINWAQMDSFSRTVCGVDVAGNGYCWGENSYGQVGNGNAINQNSPYYLSGEGAAWQKIVVGSQHACGLKMDGNVMCWGNDAFGQLGNDLTLSPHSSPVLADLPLDTYIDLDTNGFTTCALNSSGSIYCWGKGDLGQMGDGATTPSLFNPTPLQATLLTGTYQQISVGGNFVCALDNANEIKCWGGGTSGQMGNNTMTDHWNTYSSVIGTGYSKIVTGNQHACALNSGDIFCWGLNNAYQIGNNSTTSQKVPTNIGSGYIDVFAGFSHTCGIKTDYSLWCWGNNSSYQIGIGGTSPVPIPTDVNP